MRENAKNLKENSEIKKKTMKEIKIVCGKRQILGISRKKEYFRRENLGDPRGKTWVIQEGKPVYFAKRKNQGVLKRKIWVFLE